MRKEIKTRQDIDAASFTFENLRWKYGVFRPMSSGAGRNKKHWGWCGVVTALGEVEEKVWYQLAEQLIKNAGEQQLLAHLIEWESECGYTKSSSDEVRKEAIHLHVSRIFDDPEWIHYLPFNKRYRPEIWEAAHIVYVRNECCQKVSAVTQEQIDRSSYSIIYCPHCGRWSRFTILGRRVKPEGPNPCLDCDCYDPDMGCTMPGIDKSYACPLEAPNGGQRRASDA